MERAKADARMKLDHVVADWLADAGVPRTWKAPKHLVDRLIRQTMIERQERDYGTVYQAILKVDLSSQSRSRILREYERGIVARRLGTLGAILAFALTCLAALAGYIRADEATKGYYTHILRLAAAAIVGAAGVALYHVLA
ncbi:MAG: hypothetical protein IRY99_15885 [Isosphaeraceae bacterium]|nr:hypothetical protein [Isosphaeraceae bacterium]